MEELHKALTRATLELSGLIKTVGITTKNVGDIIAVVEAMSGAYE